MSLFNCIYHLGIITGFNYWRMNKYYANNPQDIPSLIDKMRKLGREENPFWDKVADDFQKSFDDWKQKTK